MKNHQLNRIEDRCSCGAEIVYFEDGDADGNVGFGCEAAVSVFDSKTTKIARTETHEVTAAVVRHTLFSNQAKEERDDEFLAALRRLRRAVEDEGRNPLHHRSVLADSRRAWPALWEAIDGLLANDRKTVR